MKINWIAHYNDGTELNQYENGKENLFGDIDQDKLVSFQLIIDNTERVENDWQSYSVNLVTGLMNLNGENLEFENFGSQNDFQLIYYRRVRNDLGANPAGQRATFNIGWKTKIDNYSFKRILKLTPTLTSDGKLVTDSKLSLK